MDFLLVMWRVTEDSGYDHVYMCMGCVLWRRMGRLFVGFV